MRKLLVAMFVGFVCQAAALAIGPPGDPGQNACPLHYSHQSYVVFDCEESWEGDYITLDLPMRYGKDCIEEQCEEVQTVALGVQCFVYTHVPGYINRIYYTETWDGDGELQECDPEETGEGCCVGWTEDGTATFDMITYEECQ